MQFVCTILSKVEVLVTLPLLRNQIPFEQMHRRALFPLSAWWEEENRENYLWDSLKCLCCL